MLYIGGARPLEPIEVGEDLKQKAYRSLKAAILGKALTAGQLYNEPSLAEQLGISRTPVREALLKLAAEGWVRYRPRRGVEVVRPTAEGMRHFYELRQALEGYAVETLAGHLSTPALEDLQAILDASARHHDSGDPAGYMAEASRFHVRLIEELRNPRFTELFAHLTEQLRLFGLEAVSASPDRARRLAEHRLLLQALRTGDGPRARQILLAHLAHLAQTLGVEPGS